jgi:3-hydroxyisobutyrate dehydrogenase
MHSFGDVDGGRRVALVGLGVMGSGMAGQLLDAGFPLVVFNRNRERAMPYVARGASLATSPSEAAADADVIVAMVADDDASREVWLGQRGALAASKPGTLLIECSTLSPSWIRHLAQAAEARGCALLEAPVTGSKVQAAAGELLFLVGGAADTLERARPVLDAMGRGAVHLGAHGSGAFLKLINNFLCGVQAASLAEALALIERSELPRDMALEVLTEGAPGSPLVKMLSARMASSDYSVHFELDLMRKDLAYCITEGQAHGILLGTAMAALREFDHASEDGSGAKDLSAVVESLRKVAPTAGGTR